MSVPRPPQLLAIVLAALVVSAGAFLLLGSGAARLDAPASHVIISTVTPVDQSRRRRARCAGRGAAGADRAPRHPCHRRRCRVEIRGASADGVMENPTGPHSVAWYNFTALPNQPGNIVMAGHLDYVNVGAAVFYHLDELQPGDEILLNLENGDTATYRVTSVQAYDADEAPVDEIVGPTEVETVTLITCGGAFNASTREYDERVIVRAERMGDEVSR